LAFSAPTAPCMTTHFKSSTGPEIPPAPRGVRWPGCVPVRLPKPAFLRPEITSGDGQKDRQSDLNWRPRVANPRVLRPARVLRHPIDERRDAETGLGERASRRPCRRIWAEAGSHRRCATLFARPAGCKRKLRPCCIVPAVLFLDEPSPGLECQTAQGTGA